MIKTRDVELVGSVPLKVRRSEERRVSPSFDQTVPAYT